jgi:PAS domain S-box-containing protein
LAVNATRDGIYDWNLLTNEIYYSPAWKSMLGYKDEELPNDFSVWEKLTTDEDIKKSWAMQNELINKKRDRFEMEFKMKHKNGYLIDVLSRAEAYFNEEGKAVRIVGTHADITKQKQAENAVKESEERYKKIVETTHDLIWSCDTEGNIWYINEACKQIYGYTPEEMTGHNFAEFLGKSQLIDHREKFAKMVEQKVGTIEFDTEIINKEGETIYLKDNISVLFENSGKPKGMLGASKNITEKIIAERALHDSMARLELALDGGGLGLWDYNPKSQQLIVSEHWSDMLGLDNKVEITAESFAKLIHPDDLKSVNDAFLECFQNRRKEFNRELRMRHSDGNWKWILSQGKIMERDEQGRAARIVGTNLDITATKHLELELQRQVKIYSSFIKYSSEGIYLFELEKPMPLDLSLEEQIKHFYHYGFVGTCNDAFAKMYGYQKSEELVGKKQSQLHGGDDVPENIDIMKLFINSGYRVLQALSKEVDKEGNYIYISNNVVGIIEDDKLVRTWGSQYDITDRINAQLELEESEKKYRLLFQTNPVPLVIVGMEELDFLVVNDAVENLLGYSKEDFSKLKLWDIRPEISIFSFSEMKAQLLKGAGVQHESKLLTKNGKTVLVEVIFDLINYEGQQAALAAFSDITALKDTEKRVLKSIIEGEDNERKRVSIEIHDSLGQNLTAASLNFDSLKQSIQNLKEKDVAKFSTGLEFLKSAIEESRNIAHNLMPKAIDDFGLILSLTSLFNQIEKSTGINVKFYENLGDGRLNRQIELNLYRITQEAITNLIKHSKASEVDIQLVLHKQEIIYTFEDNGTGFDKSSIEIAGKGMGLKSIFNRVVTMSGTFDLDSSPERGTSITITIPV